MPRTLPALLLGCALTLAARGYQFGQSNHGVYLLDACRRLDPQLLANDWFVTQTLQYHGVFSLLSALLLRWGVLQAGFLLGYLLLVVLLHLAWLRLAIRLSHDAPQRGLVVYLLSVVLYYLSAGGTGLGMYQFLQDSAFLPSNIANVALLWAIVLWIDNRLLWSGLCFGLAGLFHLNHALVGISLWTALGLWRMLDPKPDRPRVAHLLAGSVLLLIPCLINLLPALRVVVEPRPGMPLAEFVDLYVRLRHPHHYDPSSWPLALWISFLWPMPFFLWLSRRRRSDPAWRQAGRIYRLLLALQLSALLGAGVWYFSERLIQLSLYRFSIYPLLLGCLAAAALLEEKLSLGLRGSPRALAGLLAAVALAAGGLLAARMALAGRWIVPDPPDYLDVCHWARDHTPAGAVFLVPPQETSFRLHARRAIVVNYKNVPQLSTELSPWRDRLHAVLQLDDLRRLPRPMPRTLEALGERYDSRSPQYLQGIARHYGASYVVTRRDWGIPAVYRHPRGSYFVYQLAPSPDSG